MLSVAIISKAAKHIGIAPQSADAKGLIGALSAGPCRQLRGEQRFSGVGQVRDLEDNVHIHAANDGDTRSVLLPDRDAAAHSDAATNRLRGEFLRLLANLPGEGFKRHLCHPRCACPAGSQLRGKLGGEEGILHGDDRQVFRNLKLLFACDAIDKTGQFRILTDDPVYAAFQKNIQYRLIFCPDMDFQPGVNGAVGFQQSRLIPGTHGLAHDTAGFPVRQQRDVLAVIQQELRTLLGHAVICPKHLGAHCVFHHIVQDDRAIPFRVELLKRLQPLLAARKKQNSNSLGIPKALQRSKLLLAAAAGNGQ